MEEVWHRAVEEAGRLGVGKTSATTPVLRVQRVTHAVGKKAAQEVETES